MIRPCACLINGPAVNDSPMKANSLPPEPETDDDISLFEVRRLTRNFLSTLRTIAHRTMENSEDLDEFSAYFSGRLDALSRAHLFFFRKRAGGVDLAELLGEELRFPAVEDDSRVDIAGPTVALDGALGHGLSLVIHELATNAIKFGALSAPEGRLSVNWKVATRAGRRWLVFDWKESDVPAVLTEPENMGFGREMIESALPYEFGAKTSIVFAPGGIQCRIETPLERKPPVKSDGT